MCLVIWRTYYIHTILHSKYGIHASSSFPHWIPDCWYKPFVRLLCDTSVQFGFAIIAHLLYHCAKDRRGVLALHSLSYTWHHNAVKLVLYSDEGQPIKDWLRSCWYWEYKVLYMSFDKFLLAVESSDLSQADKSIRRVSSFPKLSHG